jgi:hypothetical protein
MTADNSAQAPSSPFPVAAPPVVRRTDRVVDAASALCLTAGVALFAVGRRSLTAIADGTYPAPLGESWVARADFHAAQTHWGRILIGIGVGVALISALRHWAHRRATRR